MRTDNPAVARATCRCGHDRNHPDVDAIPTFGVWAWIMLLNGASGTPKKITYKCRRCGEILGVTRDPRILRTIR